MGWKSNQEVGGKIIDNGVKQKPENIKSHWVKVMPVLTFILIMFFLGLLLVYIFVPLSVDFSFEARNSNFTLNTGELSEMQFYPNMRFPTPNITYTINDCTVKKKNDMQIAFNIIENKTTLKFTRVIKDGDISVLCDSSERIESGMFIAGEGGPSNITQTDLFNVISKGNILLIKESRCANPNIALHELLHVLGFDHSENKNNIMFPVTDCKQTIGDDIIEQINNLYEIPSYPDLAFTDVRASFNGWFFNTEIELINQGLSESERTEIIIYGDEKVVKRVRLDSLDYGYGRVITLNNIFVFSKFNTARYFINSTFNEVDKGNNEIILSIN